MYVVDVTQSQHTIRRNYPVIGRFRYLFERLGEFFRQYLFALDREELPYFIDQADWVACNDYEAQMICERTNNTIEQITERVQAFIITQGDKGSMIHTREKVYTIAAIRTDKAKDPTGCGDAYRAGLLYGLSKNLDWEITGRIASLLGAYKVECAGGQRHAFSKAEFRKRYAEVYDTNIVL